MFFRSYLPPIGFLLVVLLLIFLLGWPLEWVPIVVISLPIFLPLVTELGYDLVWCGTLVAVSLQTAWLSPPVALSAYFLKGVVPDWDLKDLYIGMLQFMVLQFFAVGLLIAFQQLALWRPSVLLDCAVKKGERVAYHIPIAPGSKAPRAGPRSPPT